MKKFIAVIYILAAAFYPGRGFSEPVHEVVLSSYTTFVAEQELPVKTNIRISSSKLNGVEIPSGKTFSFNETVGEGSAANGYLSGRVLYQDRSAYEAGGGICQVSSTLFNALILAGCVIIERHRHAYPVTYVPPGLDATIKYGKKDLRIKNPHQHSIFINTSMNDSTLLITIRAGGKIRGSYEIYTEEETVNIPFEESGRKVKPGSTIYVYRKKIINGKVKETALLYRDFYPPTYID
ncbi:MAG TPA: VanW family protein [Spirochaetota bacterium]|nr:VanW family protein [Spirochaetota bacterium]HPF06946.1 VanW family protein [Spirochaetota bacterium]HPJ43004.1 VanW family protein [Spirochaetota bacterium]HPR37648.1 VanW family protein [Spirochaetota bacterium]HRX46890.1 VanW family protein [Spirochaetota bacterium]